MGKSDPIIFNAYRNALEDRLYNSVGFFGNSKASQFTDSIQANKKSYFDLELDNWDINTFPYKTRKKFDLIVCTRCAYFSSNPEKTIDEFYRLLKPGGTLLIDWGVGDHWRFENYKVGWVKDDQHESHYSETNYLWSCVWDDGFLNHPEFIKFSTWVRKFGYNDIKSAIFKEVPKILEMKYVGEKFNTICGLLALWEESPQLYFILVCKKREN
jgi:SAM-dependent methyltransferase